VNCGLRSSSGRHCRSASRALRYITNVHNSGSNNNNNVTNVLSCNRQGESSAPVGRRADGIDAMASVGSSMMMATVSILS
jgi:hypothetical protein